MKKLLLPLFLLPFGVFAQSDTLYVKGGTKYAVTINKIENGQIHFNTGTGSSSMPESSIERYYWPNKPAIPEHKDNIIMVETTDSPEEAFVKLGRILATQGYPITTANKEIGIINTGPKTVIGATGLLLNTLVESKEGKTRLIISGTLDGVDITLYGVTTDSKMDLYYTTSAFNQLGKIWAEMDKIARSYGGKVSYGKR